MTTNRSAGWRHGDDHRLIFGIMVAPFIAVALAAGLYPLADFTLDHAAPHLTYIKACLHFSFYAAITFVIYWPLRGWKYDLRGAVFITSVAAILDELFQAAKSSRRSSVSSLLIDMIGIGLAAFLIKARRKSQPRA